MNELYIYVFKCIHLTGALIKATYKWGIKQAKKLGWVDHFVEASVKALNQMRAVIGSQCRDVNSGVTCILFDWS